MSGPDHSFTIACKNVHGAFTKQSLRSVGMVFIHFKPACQWGPTCGKEDHPWQPYLVRGDRLWQPYLVRGDRLWQHNLPQMVRGNQLRRGNCGVTGPAKIEVWPRETCVGESRVRLVCRSPDSFTAQGLTAFSIQYTESDKAHR